jgi:hypothetical protein
LQTRELLDSSAITNLAEVSGVASPDGSPNGEIIITAVSTLTNIVITPASPVIVTGTSEAFSATGNFSDGSASSLAATNGLVWSSSNPGIATINTNGVATGLSAGTTTITATEGSFSNYATLTVQLLTLAQTNIFLFTGSETNLTLPPGTYTITAYGAQGGAGLGSTGGLGAEMEGEFSFSGLTTLTLLVGGNGGGGSQYYSGGGGGGSFVVNGSSALVVAGGGGGGVYGGSGGTAGLATTNGGNGLVGFYGNSGGVGGVAGGGGGVGDSFGGGGGGGFLGNGVSGGYGAGGFSFENGSAGGTTSSGGGGAGGGYGGGGASGRQGGGGGGGYSGGGAGEGNGGGGGGGGSIIDASAITNLAEVSGIASPDGSPNGEIIITVVPAPPALGVATYGGQPAVFFPAATGTNFALQMTTNLTSGNWVTVTNGIPISGVIITAPPGAAFFRLH